MMMPPLPEPIGIQHDETVGGVDDIYFSRQMLEYGQLCIDKYKSELAQELRDSPSL